MRDIEKNGPVFLYSCYKIAWNSSPNQSLCHHSTPELKTWWNIRNKDFYYIISQYFPHIHHLIMISNFSQKYFITVLKKSCINSTIDQCKELNLLLRKFNNIEKSSFLYYCRRKHNVVVSHLAFILPSDELQPPSRISM